MRLIKLTDTNGEPIFVNPSTILTAQSYKEGSRVYLSADPDRPMYLAESVEKIVSIFEMATCQQVEVIR
jgi:hypothetical protein